MDLTFKSKKLEKSLTVDKEIVKSYGQRAKKVKMRMEALDEAENLEVISLLPALRLHPYKGARKGEWSIDVVANWRICFEIDQDPIPTKEDGGVDLTSVTEIRVMSVEDPH